MKKKIILILLCVALLLSMAALLAGCAEKFPTTADNNGVTVVVTSPAAHALVRPLTQSYTEDGGTKVVTVVPLYKLGQDIHSFEPTAKDVVSLANADVVVCTGSEGWLEASLKAAGDKEKYCFLHYPPIYQGYRCQEIIDLLERYGVTRCCYGHLHGGSHRLAITGLQGTVDYSLVSADYLGFRPKLLLD